MMDWNGWSENVSDETLAAFIDGNATAEEVFRIENSMATDEMLQECLDIVEDSISVCQNVDYMDMWKGDYGFWEMGIPPVFSMNELDNLVSFPLDVGNSTNILGSLDISEMDTFEGLVTEEYDNYDVDINHSDYDLDDGSDGFYDINLE